MQSVSLYRRDYSDNWFFVRRKASGAWLSGEGAADAVRMPHCWNASETFTGSSSVYHGWGSYRKDLEIPHSSAERKWFICAGGFRGVGDIRVNGLPGGYFDGAYLGFRHEITDVIRPGERNTIALRMTNRCSADILPGIKNPDFVFYGGAAGGLWIEERPSCSVEIESVNISDPMGSQPSVQVEARIYGFRASLRGYDLNIRIRDPGNTEITATSNVSCSAVEKEQSASLHAQLAIVNPKRWSPDTPVLYSVVAELRYNGETVDSAVRKFGIRELKFLRDKGCFINGRHTPLRGCNRHENIPGWGNALPPALSRRDARLIAGMGLNFVRLAHYPQSPDFLDACDELGILVYAEIATWKSVRKGKWLKNARRQLSGMIKRDHHHPSVILWGLGNESRERTAYTALRETAYRCDPEKRPVIYAENHLYRARRENTLGITDIWGANYEVNALPEGIKQSRLGVGILSECANIPYARRGQTHFEIEQIEAISSALEGISSVGDSCAGFALWSFNDYATLRKGRTKRECGILDGMREMKLSAYWLRMFFGESGSPSLQVRVDWAKHGALARRVIVLSDADSPRVAVGTKRYEVSASPFAYLYTVDIEFEDTPLTVTAGSSRQQRVSTILPWGAAASIAISENGIELPGDDIIIIHLEVRDNSGAPVRLFEEIASVTSHKGVDLYCVNGNNLMIRGGCGTLYARRCGKEPFVIEIQCSNLSPLSISEEDRNER